MNERWQCLLVRVVFVLPRFRIEVSHFFFPQQGPRPSFVMHAQFGSKLRNRAKSTPKCNMRTTFANEFAKNIPMPPIVEDIPLPFILFNLLHFVVCVFVRFAPVSQTNTPHSYGLNSCQTIAVETRAWPVSSAINRLRHTHQ